MGSFPVNVIGWYDKQNLGDESYKLSFPLLFPQADFLFSENHKREALVTILGGGDVVTPDNLTKLRASKGRKFIMSVTISQDLPRSFYEDVERIVVRDKRAFNRLKQLNLPVTLCPDFSSILKGDPVEGRSFLVSKFKSQSLDLYTNTVLVVLNSHLVREATTRQHFSFEKLSYDIAEITDTTSASFIFCPFGSSFPWDDRVPNSWTAIKAKFWKKNLVVYDHLTVQNSLNLISAVDAVVSTRLHSSIFSMGNGIPFLDITHNHKNPQFLDLIGRPDLGVPLVNFDLVKARGILNALLQDKTYKQDMGRLAAEQTDKIREVVSGLRIV